MLCAPSCRAASNVRSTSVSTTTRWKLAQKSATSCRLRGPASGGTSSPGAIGDTALLKQRAHGGLEAGETELRDGWPARRASASAGGSALRSACVNRGPRQVDRIVAALTARV